MLHRWGAGCPYTPFNFLSLLSQLPSQTSGKIRDKGHLPPISLCVQPVPLHRPACFVPAPLPTYCPPISGPLTFSLEARIQVLGRRRAVFEPCPFAFTSMKASYTLSLYPVTSLQIFLVWVSCDHNAPTGVSAYHRRAVRCVHYHSLPLYVRWPF